MNSERVISALDLPSEAIVDKRIPKKLLVENGTPTAADKRQINEGIEELIWVAALKPNTIGVPEYRDSDREILEIAVLQLVLRLAGKSPRIVELIHRAIPYPVFLVSKLEKQISLSLATKRWAQNEAHKTVLDSEPISIALIDDPRADAFLQSISLRNCKPQNLQELYFGWKSLFQSYMIASFTGAFKSSLSTSETEKRQKALEVAESLQGELFGLRAQAKRETQMNRRVDLNMQIKALEARLSEAIKDMA